MWLAHPYWDWLEELMLVMRALPVIRRDPSKQDGIGYIMQAITHNIGFHNSM
jgi:hypothetical protein